MGGLSEQKAASVCVFVCVCVQGRLDKHQHYVQGVAWDPLGYNVLTVSNDRTVNVSVRGDTHTHAHTQGHIHTKREAHTQTQTQTCAHSIDTPIVCALKCGATVAKGQRVVPAARCCFLGFAQHR